MHRRQGTFTGDMSLFWAGLVIAFIVLSAPCGTLALHATFRAAGFEPTGGSDPAGRFARTMRSRSRVVRDLWRPGSFNGPHRDESICTV